jgi:LL-diaminopimelate aminotransferase
MFDVKPADRLAALPPYLFAEIDRKKQRRKAKGLPVIDLGVGDPDLPTPAPILARLAEAALDARNHRYPPGAGLPEFREAVAGWYKRRYNVALDSETEVTNLIGSKEGIGHLPLALVNPGEEVWIPDPGYPVYLSGTIFAGGSPRFMPLRHDLGFLPDLDAIEGMGFDRARLVFVNYPNNPTGAVASRSFYERLIELARRHKVIVVADAAYAELADTPAPSILEVDGAKDVAVEIGSFSKTFNMTGWRVGWAVGNAALIRALVALKTNLDSGCAGAIQCAAIRGFDLIDEHLPALKRVYAERREVALEGLGELGIEVFPSGGTFYVWAKVPGDLRSVEWSARVLDSTGVVTTPGVGFGPRGEGYFRLALCSEVAAVRDAMVRLQEAGLWAVRSGS